MNYGSQRTAVMKGQVLLLSLFCGAGGLDLGFEQAGFEVGLAIDKNPDSVTSYIGNRLPRTNAVVGDVRELSLDSLDVLWGGRCMPSGIIGGPPCQSFSQANQVRREDDPRHDLPLVYAKLLSALNRRSPIPFFLLENVAGLRDARHQHRLTQIIRQFEEAGFRVSQAILNSLFYNTPQKRRRLFLVGLNTEIFGGLRWQAPEATSLEREDLTVAGAIGHLPEPVLWEPGLDPSLFPFHSNHWAMMPKSAKFKEPGKLVPGNGRHRSFKTLQWDKPSLTVAYGNREVHVHPGCHRRLSVYEAMLLQGFPSDYVLSGSLSSQILQISEAVPPPLAKALADALVRLQSPVIMRAREREGDNAAIKAVPQAA